MGELTSQLLGNFLLRLFSASRCEKQALMPYIKLEWGANFHKEESRMQAGYQAGYNVLILTATSAHLTRQLLETTYAVCLQNSDQQTLIRQLLKIPLNTAE